MMTRDEAQPADGQPRPTPLRAIHESLGAAMTDFAGWLMPLRYRSETAEHRAVRGAAGLFDLSHMGEIAVSGPGAAAALDYALVGHLSALQPGRARYTMICAPGFATRASSRTTASGSETYSSKPSETTVSNWASSNGIAEASA